MNASCQELVGIQHGQFERVFRRVKYVMNSPALLLCVDSYIFDSFHGD
jgi:hypothetical protein